jgi:O-antigen ligase
LYISFLCTVALFFWYVYQRYRNSTWNQTRSGLPRGQQRLMLILHICLTVAVTVIGLLRKSHRYDSLFYLAAASFMLVLAADKWRQLNEAAPKTSTQ